MSLRPEVPLRIVPELGINACYIGPPDARVEVGAELVSMLTREELLAVVAHEAGHRNLWHIEQRYAMLFATYGATVGAMVYALSDLTAWWWPAAAYAAGVALNELLAVLQEFQADAYARKVYGAQLVRVAFNKVMRRHRPHWLSKARLAVMNWAERR